MSKLWRINIGSIIVCIFSVYTENGVFNNKWFYLIREGLILIISCAFLEIDGVECPELDSDWVESLLPAAAQMPGRAGSLLVGNIDTLTKKNVN